MKWRYLWRTFDEEGNIADQDNKDVGELNDTNEEESTEREKGGDMFVIIFDLFMLDNNINKNY